MTISRHNKKRIPLMALTIVILTLDATVRAYAAPYTGPIKEIPASYFGREVNLTEVEKHSGPAFEDVCDANGNSVCQPAKESTIAGGYAFPQGVAVDDDLTSADYGNIYVADTANSRIQEITAAGAFVRMFGWNVNETKEKEGAPQAERNVCTAASGDTCKAGVFGGNAEQLSNPYGIAVDQATGNLYVQDLFNWRVNEYTSSGQFVLMIGMGVNETKEKEGAPQAARNVCTAASGDVCKAGAQNVVGDTEKGAFNFLQFLGNVLTVGGPDDLLYVGDEHRIQEFDPATGEFKHEISLTSISSDPKSWVVALAVDQTGDVYFAYQTDLVADLIHELGPSGEPINEFKVRAPEAPEGVVNVTGMALDSTGRLGVTEKELGNPAGVSEFGSLYVAGTGRLVTEFANSGISGIAFNRASELDELYAAVPLSLHEIVAYAPVHVAELLINPVTCKPGSEIETSASATFDCTLNGEVNPEGVPGTTVWFQWGRTALEAETAKKGVQDGEMLVSEDAEVGNLRPSENYRYRLAGEDQNVKPPELITSETGTFETPAVQPKIIGAPNILFANASSVVIHAEFNPEKANTKYFVEYEACKELANNELVDCQAGQDTAQRESTVYRKIDVTLEATELQPATAYRYRLVASNAGGTVLGTPGMFTTTPAPSLRAEIGLTSAVTTTSATISGAVDPDGQPAIYRFEFGVNNGAATQYAVAFSGPTDAGTVPIPESLTLTGLQPGTTYAYRITILSGYGAAQSTPGTFTTSGLPEVLTRETATSVILPIPKIHFPSQSKCKAGFTHDKTGKCVRTKTRVKRRAKTMKKKRNKRKRG